MEPKAQAQVQTEPTNQATVVPVVVEPTQEPTAPRATGSSYYQGKINEYKDSNAALQAQIDELQTSTLKEKESFKELYELEKQKREKAEVKAQDLSKTVFKSFKSSAIKDAAVELGILPSAIEDLDMLDSSLVQVETTDQGRINIIGAKDFVESIKEKRQHWFTNLAAPIVNVNNPSQNISGKQMTATELVQLQKTDPTKYNELMAARFNKN